MCEIAIIRPSMTNIATACDIVENIYETQGDSLGVVAVHQTEDKTEFEYDILKATVPDKDNVRNFIEGAYNEEACRVIAHGRMATHGEVTVENAHPIEIDCPQCSVDYVLHNGVVRGHGYDKREHKEKGHEYATKVDSEVIAHNYCDVPTRELDRETWYHKNQSAFLLLDDGQVFISAGRGYHLTKDIRMQKTYRNYGVVSDDEDKYIRAVLTPSEAE